MIRNFLKSLRSGLSRSRIVDSAPGTTIPTLTSVALRRNEDIIRLAELLSEDYECGKDSEERLSTDALKQTLHLLGENNVSPGFSLHVQESLVGGPLAGEGLFVKSGHISPGTVTAIYPGTALYHEDVQFFGGVHNMYIESEMTHFIHRSDGIVIDGLEKTFELNSCLALGESDGGDVESTSQTELLDKFEELQRNGYRGAQRWRQIRHPYAVAHKANHPPVGARANVVAVAFDYKFDQMQQECLDSVPTRHALLPKFLCPHGISFVASRHIGAGEEIYLDYSVSTETRPEWYVEAERD